MNTPVQAPETIAGSPGDVDHPPKVITPLVDEGGVYSLFKIDPPEMNDIPEMQP